jgi:hypothetical protein
MQKMDETTENALEDNSLLIRGFLWEVYFQLHFEFYGGRTESDIVAPSIKKKQAQYEFWLLIQDAFSVRQ